MKYEKITTVDAIKATGYNNKELAEWLIDKGINFNYIDSNFVITRLNFTVPRSYWLIWDNGTVTYQSDSTFRNMYRAVPQVGIVIDPT